MLDKFLKFSQIIKVDEQTHMTWGIVTSESPDKDNEICDYTEAKKAYKKWSEDFLDKTISAGQDPSMGNVRVMHGNEIGGKVIKLEFKDDEKQVWLGTQPADDATWKLIKGGYITGLSQGGKYIWKKKEGDFIRYAPTIAEVSYVDNPCLGEATFAYVKSDGSMEMKKFAKQDDNPADPELKARLEEIRIFSKGSCVCKCASCKDGNCAGCSSDTKCQMSAKADKAVKYLVEVNGEKHLPYTNEDGKPNHRLLGAAWAALFNEKGYRGNKYEGPNKEQAKKKLKQIYAREGMDTPAEKSDRVDSLLKAIVEDRLKSKSYGSFGKGMYAVTRFASIIEDLKYLWLSLEYEREQEGDSSPVTDDLKGTFEDLLDHLLAYTEEQIEEEKAKLKE